MASTFCEYVVPVPFTYTGTVVVPVMPSPSVTRRPTGASPTDV